MRKVHEGNGVGGGIQHPGPQWLAIGAAFQSDALRHSTHGDSSENLPRGGVDGEEFVRPSRGHHERGIVVANLDGIRRRKGHAFFGVLRRQRFEVDESRRVGAPSLGGDACDAVEECAVLQLGQALFARPGAAVDVIARIRLCNVSNPVRVHGQSVEQGAQCRDGLDELVGRCVEYEQVAIRHLGILDDVHDVTQRKHVVGGDGVVPCIERHEVAVGLACATRKLRLVSRLERDHIKLP